MTENIIIALLAIHAVWTEWRLAKCSTGIQMMHGLIVSLSESMQEMANGILATMKSMKKRLDDEGKGNELLN